jgi:hypothetical protein
MHTSANRPAQLSLARSDVLPDGHLGDLLAVLVDEALMDALGRVALLRGASRSAISHASMIDRYVPSFGAGRLTGARFAGGSADANACLTARRCTP